MYICIHTYTYTYIHVCIYIYICIYLSDEGNKTFKGSEMRTAYASLAPSVLRKSPAPGASALGACAGLPPVCITRSTSWRPSPWKVLRRYLSTKRCPGHPTLGKDIVQEMIVIRIGCTSWCPRVARGAARRAGLLRARSGCPHGGRRQQRSLVSNEIGKPNNPN